LATLLLTPVAAGLARRLGVLDQPADNKYHQQATPYLGGLAVAVGLVLVGGVAAGASGQLLTVLLGGLALSIVGLLDDRLFVGPILKLSVEVAAGVALWLVGVRAGLFGVEALDLLLTVFWVVAITNAVNLLDNMDGLCAGIAAISAMTFFAIAAGRGDYLVGSFALAVSGASLGFLRHNFPPARIFLGDSGTLLLGFLLAALGLKLDLVGEGGFVRSAIPVLVLGVAVFDTALVLIDRLRGGRRFYVGGTDHTSHRLARAGLSPRRVALTLYGAQIVLSGIALFLLNSSTSVGMAVVATSVVVALVALRFFVILDRRLQGPEGPVLVTEPSDGVEIVQTDRPVEYGPQ
jgi:UDP-GlcNAc:undecaprenyl-phosphate/decaprenyl-phosphate GlcNAc-1-phosphate transferase